MQVRKRLSRVERRLIKHVLEGRTNPNGKEATEILSRLHVAVALEALLDINDLDDHSLCYKLKTIMDRKPELSLKSGKSNQTTIDANTINAIRMVWQAQGRFTDKQEITHKGAIANMSDEQLDKMIASGAHIVQSVKIGKKEGDNATGSSPPNRLTGRP